MLLGSDHVSSKTFYYMISYMHLFNETDVITTHIWLSHNSAAKANWGKIFSLIPRDELT